MYAEWASLQDEIQCSQGCQSVLHRFPSTLGRDVSLTVVKCIASNLSSAVACDEASSLEDEKDVKWTMEVLCFGLGLPLTEHETVNDCAKIYLEWLSALTVPSLCVPKPVIDDPNPFAQVMLQHLLNLFKSRQDSGVDLVKRQAQLCHRVLRAIQVLAKESSVLSRDTWNTLLMFLMAANDNLLSPPTEKDDISDHLCDRVLSVLFGVWLLACDKCFPSPSMWKTFRNMCVNWRHHESLIVHWHRVNHILTANMIRSMFGPQYPAIILLDDDQQMMLGKMSAECVAQAWFRFLHVIHSPVDLSRPLIISNTPRFLQHALTNESIVDPSQHGCLSALPTIFLKAMRGISIMVNAFLGLPQDLRENLMSTPENPPALPEASASTPPVQRKPIKPMSVLASKVSSKSGQATKSIGAPSVNNMIERISLSSRYAFASSRPSCNSILHLFGSWLFDAALVGVRIQHSHASPVNNRRGSSFIGSQQHSLSLDLDVHNPTSTDNTYGWGRAEACGTLCSIFCAHKTDEEILPVYYSRFYLILYYGLQTGENDICGQVLVSILMNSCDLLRADLSGVQVLTPYVLKVLELVLCSNTSELKLHDLVPSVELRTACMHLILSILCLPLHFKDVVIRDISLSNVAIASKDPGISFLSLKNRIIDLLRVALTNESDPCNTQMLLGGLMLVVQDMAVCEEVETVLSQSSQDSSDSDNSPDTAYGLFGHAASLVCNRLMASWKTDLNTALSAMELLSGLAKVVVTPQNILMCKRTVKWICDFIVFQCSRPAPNHSRDLHTLIVAAFKCIQLWLAEHHRLLYDKECLYYVLEVVELGISGSKSQNRASDPPRYKGCKELIPASMRVKDAAEAVLVCIIDQVGAFPPPCGPESLFSLLDEKSLMKYSKSHQLIQHGSSFRYFVIDNSIIMSLLEEPIGMNEERLPTVTALIRGAFGRHAWTMQLRHSARLSNLPSSVTMSPIGRPAPVDNVGTHYLVNHCNFPEDVDKIPKVKADCSIPIFESLSNETDTKELENIEGFIESCIEFEQCLVQNCKSGSNTLPDPGAKTTCQPPRMCHEYQTARLLLSHYGFLSLESLKEPFNDGYSSPPSLLMLDSSKSSLASDLEMLDIIPSRDNDTIHVFYVMRNQKVANDILSNVMSYRHVKPQFLEFLHSLGWPVDVLTHAGWTGHLSSSWKILKSDGVQGCDVFGIDGSVYDGTQRILYWADVSSELAIVVPSLNTSRQRTVSFDKSSSLYTSHSSSSSSSIAQGVGVSIPRSSMSSSYTDSSISKLTASGHAANSSAASMDYTNPWMKPPHLDAGSLSHQKSDQAGFPVEPDIATGGRPRRLGRSSQAMVGSDTKILVVWLEALQDKDTFPTGDVLKYTLTGQELAGGNSLSMTKATDRDVYIIFIHPLKNGLFRIHIQEYERTQTKISVAIPLVDGMVVSRRTLGTLVQQTAINICRRRRLESESYQPPHVRRKLKIQEIVDKYRCNLSPAEFYASVFHPSSS